MNLLKVPTVALTAYANSILTPEEVRPLVIVLRVSVYAFTRHIYHEISIYDCGCC